MSKVINKSCFFIFAITLLVINFSFNISAQNNNSNNVRKDVDKYYNKNISDIPALTLTDCIKYSLKNQPAINQSIIDQYIAETNNNIAISNWLPQVIGTANYTNYFQLPTVFSNTNNGIVSVKSGVFNYSIPQFTISQNIYSPDALFAVKAAKLNKTASSQSVLSTKINFISDVSKAYYDVLLSIQQISVYKEDTARLNKNQSDAFHRYKSGIVDKVDYKQATIALNNSLAKLKTANEILNSKYAILKQFMAYPANKTFTVEFDTAKMFEDIYIDTLAPLQFENRIEYQQLLTTKLIAGQNVLYYKMAYLPSVSAFYNYNYEFESNHFSDLYNKPYPYSLFGLQLTIPVFTGFRRLDNIHKAKLQEQRLDLDIEQMVLGIYTQYVQATSNYKSNLYYFKTQKENVEMAKEVYDIVKFQYREGIKTYLDVIVAESDLQTSEINYLNALFQVLSSKIDLKKAMGVLQTDI